MALTVEPNVPVAFFDSGLEFPETYAYIGQLARDWKFSSRLHWITASPTLLEILHDSAPRGTTTAPGQKPSPDLHEALITEPAAMAHRPAARGSCGVCGPRNPAAVPPCMPGR